MSNNVPAIVDQMEVRAGGPEALDALRQKFVSSLDFTARDLARELEVTVPMAVELMTAQNWLQDRKKFFKVARETERLRYQELIQQKRLPAVERQLKTLERFETLVYSVMEQQEQAHEDLDRARQDGLSGENLIVYLKRLPSATAMKDLATAIEKITNSIGKLLNIRDDLFSAEEEGEGGSGIKANFLVIPGAQPVGKSNEKVIDVTPQ